MAQVGAPRSDVVPIGDAATPSFVRLPRPERMFAARAARFAALAQDSPLAPYLGFLAQLSGAQHRILDGLPAAPPPSAAALARAREFVMPPLDRARMADDSAFSALLDGFLTLCRTIGMPDAARAALGRLQDADAAARAALARAAFEEAVPADALDALGERVFAAAALQVHAARLAAALDPAQLVPVGDGVCPACGGPPAASLVVGWPGAHGARYCACALCGALWNQVRIKCALCGSTEGVAYQEIAEGPAAVKAETCDACGCYVKILHQHLDPALDPIADDVATLALDLLMREAGRRRGALNPFLAGY